MTFSGEALRRLGADLSVVAGQARLIANAAFPRAYAERDRLRATFREAGWRCDGGASSFLYNPPPTRLLLATGRRLEPLEALVAGALGAAGIAFDQRIDPRRATGVVTLFLS